MSIRQNKRASDISRVEGPVFHESPVVNTELGPYIDPEIHFDFEENPELIKRARTDNYDKINPVYQWVDYDALTNQQKAFLPHAIRMEIQHLKKMIPQTRRLPDYSYPIVIIGQNINNPYDLKCDTQSRPPYRSPYFGLDDPRCFIDPAKV